eukprot:TRINITY_DN1147_c0_g2_i1.p1 TRINITY_DN1147_c0_g2~~TRINITY_DN1147_c0_g2_i1.p1  ORF type:complete len:317 (+),score=38.05 TRINITY_DN1147_c0_g2_i1:216-1166(+)
MAIVFSAPRGITTSAYFLVGQIKSSKAGLTVFSYCIKMLSKVLPRNFISLMTRLANRTSESVSTQSTGPRCPMTSLPTDLNEFFLGRSKDNKTTKSVFIIGIAGGTASGKTSVCELIIQQLSTERVVTISLDSFYKPLTHKQLENVSEYNFDIPDAFDWDLLQETLHNLYLGKGATFPKYDFGTHSRIESESHKILGLVNVILLEGILVFYKKEIRDYLDLMIFVDTDSDVRLARRVMRDMKFRGRTLDSILMQYEKTVKPAFEDFIWPTKKYADVVIPRGAENTIAINLIVEHIRHKMLTKNRTINRRFLSDINL